MADLGEGAVFAGHRIEGVAGRGGMGTVYRATHLVLDHVVALKVIAGEIADQESFRARFKSESRIAVSLRHPNVVPIHHAGEEDGLLFVTMDLIDGPDLRRLLAGRGPLDPVGAIAILEQVAAALDVAHSRGLVHRDIKPANVLIEERAGSEHVYLTDFGLTKHTDQPSDASALTSTGAFVGTLDYVAPEQIRGDELDARTDVYALGCVLYEMLTARAPFSDREEKVAKIYAHLQDDPERLGGELAALNEVVDRALAKDREGRFPSAGDLARAAAAALEGEGIVEAERSVATGPAAPTQPHAAPVPVAAPTEPAIPAEGPSEGSERPERPSPAEPSRAGARRRRNPLPILASALLLAALIGGGVVLLGGGDDGGQSGGGSSGGSGGAAGAVASTPRVPGFTFGLSYDSAEEILRVGNRRGEMFAVGSQGEVDGGQPLGFGRLEDVVVADDATYVAAPEQNVVVRLGEGGEVSPIAVGAAPQGIAAGKGAVWVANSGDASVSRIGTTEAVSSPVSLPGAERPHGVAVGERELWVSSRDTDEAFRLGIDGSGPTAEPVGFPVGANPKGLAIAADAVWVANTDDGTLSRLDSGDGQPLGDAIAVGETPRDVISAFGRLWVTRADEGEDGGEVVVLEPETAEIEDRIELPGEPEEIASGGGRIWVTTGDTGPGLVEIEPAR